MTAPSRLLLSNLPKGHELATDRIDLTSARIAAYLAATGDTNVAYADRDIAPPLAVAALALGALLEQIELPAASLHTSQEVEARAGVPLDATLALRGRIAQRSERAAMVISVLEFEVTPEGATEPTITGRTTVMMPGASRS
ncbi:MAG: MaoC family dehydratase N-terminal domain-containing protein [Dehalococcoidia bacterium]